MKKTLLVALALILFSFEAHAESLSTGKIPTPAPSGQSSKNVERVNVDILKQRYWETADDTDPKVVQNRIYKKEHKFELGLFVGTLSSDPFLSVRSLGGSLGFHFTETWGLNLFAWKSFSSKSSSLDRLEQETGRSANTNDPKSYKGGEIAYSPIYGKLSVFGKAILHYDLHFLGGAGITDTQSGIQTTLHLGVGQQIYLSKVAALRLDYRLMRYNENILEQHSLVVGLGKVIASRVNFTDALTLGVSFFFGFGD